MENFKSLIKEALTPQHLKEINYRDLESHPDYEILKKAIEDGIGIRIEEWVRSGKYDGREGYYQTVEGVRVWADDVRLTLERIFDKANAKTQEYNFEFYDVEDEEEDPGERIYSANIKFFADEKSDDNGFLEESFRDDVIAAKKMLSAGATEKEVEKKYGVGVINVINREAEDMYNDPNWLEEELNEGVGALAGFIVAGLTAAVLGGVAANVGGSLDSLTKTLRSSPEKASRAKENLKQASISTWGKFLRSLPWIGPKLKKRDEEERIKREIESALKEFIETEDGEAFIKALMQDRDALKVLASISGGGREYKKLYNIIKKYINEMEADKGKYAGFGKWQKVKEKFFKLRKDVKGGEYKDTINKAWSSRNELKEFIEGELKTRNQVLFDKLVPGSGNTGTLEGEMLRAINRIAWRWWNDGDKFYEGYGTETAGPAHSFLINSENPINIKLESILDRAVTSENDEGYERVIEKALEMILDYIESKEGNYTKSEEDLFDYPSEYEDEEEELWDDSEYWEDDEDEEDQYDHMTESVLFKVENDQIFRSAVRWAKGDIIQNDAYSIADVDIAGRLEDHLSELFKVSNKLGIYDDDQWHEIYDEAFDDLDNSYGIPQEYIEYVEDSYFAGSPINEGEDFYDHSENDLIFKVEGKEEALELDNKAREYGFVTDFYPSALSPTGYPVIVFPSSINNLPRALGLIKKIVGKESLNEDFLKEGRDAVCATCGEHGYDEDLDGPCTNCGDSNWSTDYEGLGDRFGQVYEAKEKPKYKKGDKVIISRTYKGGVGKDPDVKKGKEKTGVISKRIKKGNRYEYVIAGTTYDDDEIKGLAEGRMSDDEENQVLALLDINSDIEKFGMEEYDAEDIIKRVRNLYANKILKKLNPNSKEAKVIKKLYTMAKELDPKSVKIPDLDKVNEAVHGDDFEFLEIKDLHYETDPDRLEDMKLAFGANFGGVTNREKIEDANYELRRYRKKIGMERLGDGPHDEEYKFPDKNNSQELKGAKKWANDYLKRNQWTEKKYEQWIEDVASGGGAEHAYDMAQNAKMEAGLIDWVRKNRTDFGDVTPLERIQYDIEALAESINENVDERTILTFMDYLGDGIFDMEREDKLNAARLMISKNNLQTSPDELLDATETYAFVGDENIMEDFETPNEEAGELEAHSMDETVEFENRSYDFQLNSIAQDEFGMDYDQLGDNEKEWVRDEVDNMLYESVNEDIQPLAVEELTDEALTRLRDQFLTTGTRPNEAEMALLKSVLDEMNKRGLEESINEDMNQNKLKDIEQLMIRYIDGPWIGGLDDEDNEEILKILNYPSNDYSNEYKANKIIDFLGDYYSVKGSPEEFKAELLNIIKLEEPVNEEDESLTSSDVEAAIVVSNKDDKYYVVAVDKKDDSIEAIDRRGLSKDEVCGMDKNEINKRFERLATDLFENKITEDFGSEYKIVGRGSDLLGFCPIKEFNFKKLVKESLTPNYLK